MHLTAYSGCKVIDHGCELVVNLAEREAHLKIRELFVDAPHEVTPVSVKAVIVNVDWRIHEVRHVHEGARKGRRTLVRGVRAAVGLIAVGQGDGLTARQLAELTSL